MSAYLDFYTLFSAATDREIIPANDNGPKPEKPYLTLRVQTGSPLPVHAGHVNENGMRRLSSHRTTSIQLQVYGDGSWDVAEQLALLLSKDSTQALAEALNITINQQVRIQDVPALVDKTTYESRAIVDIEASYTASTDDSVGVVETIEGTFETFGTATDMPSVPFAATIVTP